MVALQLACQLHDLVVGATIPGPMMVYWLRTVTLDILWPSLAQVAQRLRVHLCAKWLLLGSVSQILASDAAAYVHFVFAVLLPSTVALVGTWSNDDAGGGSGSAHIFV